MPVRPLDPRVAAALCLATDATTASVCRALRDVGVDSILLKGPSFARWLYDDAGDRPYADTDLLVAPGDLSAAERVLTALGFSERHAEVPVALSSSGLRHGSAWDRPGGRPTVDLHRTFPRARTDPEVVWRLLQGHREPLVVGSAEVWCLDETARTVHVAVHVAQNGSTLPKPLEDLTRAIARVGDDVWRAAIALAAEVGVLDDVNAGLRVLPQGAALADRLGLSSTLPLHVLLPLERRPPGTQIVARLVTEGGIPAAVRMQLFPPASYLRAWAPRLAERRGGLVAAAALRPLWVVSRLPAAIVAWRRTARRSAGARGGGAR